MPAVRVTPDLRFKGFTSPWEQRELGEIVFLRGRIGFRGYKQEDLVSKGQGAITFSPADIDDEGHISLFGNKYISFEKYEESPEIKVAVGDIIFTKTASIGKIGYVAHLDSPATINPQIALLSTFANYDNYYVFLAVRTDEFMTKVHDIVGGSSVPTMSQEKLKLLTLMIPAFSEQFEIASMYEKLDNLITLHQHKCKMLQDLKAILLRKMFPAEGANVPEIRFKDFSDAWEQRRLDEQATIVGGGTPDTNNPKYWDGDIDWYAPAEMEGVRYATSSLRKITREGLNNSSATILPAGKTILFTSRAGIGKVAILKRDAATNQGFQSIVLKDNIDTYFVYAMGTRIKDAAEGIASGSTFLEISGKALGRLEFKFPSYIEQQSVASIFEKLDNLITLHQRKCKMLQDLKAILLRKMFV